MGMAASQARYLSLTARKTNTEYEGQQINQQRTALANQSAGLFNQMLALEVPTPPMATDYTKTVYTFTDTSTSESISLDSIYRNPTEASTGQYTYTISGSTKKASVLSNIGTIVPSGESTNRYNISLKDDNSTYQISVNGGTAMTIYGPNTFDGLTPYFQDAEKAGGNNDESSYPQEGDYYFKYTNPQTNVEYYIPATGPDMTVEDLIAQGEVDGGLKTYSAQSYEKEEFFHIDDAILTTASDGTGRYDYISFYPDDQYVNGDRESGELIENATRITCKLTQQTIQDDDAYDAAMETYTAKKAIYDKTIADIDAKTTIIQQQDKTLELHLDQLDTEQQAIQTEMDAVKKVIDKNIEETFKTFA